MSVEVRKPRLDEAAALEALLTEYSAGVGGGAEVSEQELRNWLRVSELLVRVAARDGRLSGYLDVVSGDGAHVADMRALDRESADALIAVVEESAADARGAVLRGYVHSGDSLARAAYEAAGWQVVRHSFEMQVELDGRLPAADWPDGLTVRAYREGEGERVHAAVEDAFADHWEHRPRSFEHWRGFALDRDDFDPSLWLLVEDDDELAGFSLNQWHFSGDPRYGWIGSLGVRPRWRRRGLATALLRHSFRDFRDRGATRVGLGVDAENTTGAVRLYERVGMHPVRRDDTYGKRL